MQFKHTQNVLLPKHSNSCPDMPTTLKTYVYQVQITVLPVPVKCAGTQLEQGRAPEEVQVSIPGWGRPYLWGWGWCRSDDGTGRSVLWQQPSVVFDCYRTQPFQMLKLMLMPTLVSNLAATHLELHEAALGNWRGRASTQFVVARSWVGCIAYLSCAVTSAGFFTSRQAMHCITSALT